MNASPRYFFIARPKFALVIALVMTLAGLLAIKQLPVAEYPPVAPPNIRVTTSYPGASSKVVEESVASVMEESINGVEHMIYMSSKSANDGSYRLTVTFDVGTDPDLALIQVKNRVSLAEPRLPQEVKQRGITVDKQSPDILMIVGFYSPDDSLDYAYLSNYTKINVVNQLKRVPGVSDATIIGQADYSMRLWLDPDRMANFGITATDVLNAMREQNVQVAAGKIGAPPFEGNLQTEYTLQVKGRLDTPEEFGEVIIRANADGSTVYLRDVARVELGQSDYSVTGELNRKTSAALALYLLPEANALQTGKKVKDLLEQMSQTFPQGLAYKIGYDTTRYVSVAINQVVHSLFEAVALVVLVTFLFLGNWRMTLVPTIAIPVSLIATFVVLLGIGMSINTVTLFGLVLAIGIVVDDAILVIENVERLMHEHPDWSAAQATEQTMREVGGPIIATTLVLLAVFIPVALLPGITGQIFRQFAVTICVSVLFSAVNALSLSPALCVLLLKPGEQHQSAWFRRFNRALDKVRNGYGRGVAFIIHRIVIMGVVYALLAGAALWLFEKSPTGFVPTEDKGAMFVNIQLPDASSLQRTTATIKKVVAMVEAQPEVESVTAIIGFSVLSGAAQSNAGTLFVVLKHWDDRKGMDHSVMALAQRVNGMAYMMLPEAQVFAITPPAVPGMGVAGGTEFVIEDTLARPHAELAGVINNMVADLSQQPGFANVFSTFRANVPQYLIDVDRQKAKTLGVPLSEIFNTLQAQLGSTYINDFTKFGQTYRVIMQAESKFRSDLDDLDALYVRSDAGEMVPISTLMTTEAVLGPDVAERYNLYRSATVRASMLPGVSSSVGVDAVRQVAKSLPDGYQLEWTGFTFQELSAGNLAVYAFALALVFVYLFLVAQYESWSTPIAIILLVPVAMLGAIGLLSAVGMPFNLYAQIGVVLLIGLAAKNAILIVEFARKLRENDGHDIASAARTAAHLRFRAVIMTVLCFVLGILPLVFAQGAGMFSQKSVGITVLGGMLAVLFIGVLFIPALYVCVQRTREHLKGRVLRD